MKEEKIKMTLIQGDCLKVLPTIPDESVDLVLTDPPYFVLNTVEKIRDIAKKWDLFESKEEYKKFNISYLNEFYRVLKDRSSCFVFWSERHLFLFNEVLKNTKFKLYKIVIWHYPNILKGFSNKRWHNTYDFIFHLIKGEKPKVFNASFVKEENKDVWVFSKPQFNFKKDKKFHSTQKPFELMKRLVKMFSNEGDVVLDSFVGSGTTMIACRNLKRSCIGIEINPEYIEICKKRLNWGSLSDKIEWEFKNMSD
jgi:DNA modification methylase